MLIINKPLLNDIKKADAYIQQLYKKWPAYIALRNGRSGLHRKFLVVMIGWIFTWGWIYLFRSAFEAIFSVSISLLLFVLFVISSIILGTIVYCVLLKQEKREMDERAVQFKRVQTEINQICQEGEAYILAIPEMFRYPLATSYLCQIIETGRAESMKEALNLLEVQLHHWRMEQQMNKMLQNQQIINGNLNAIWFATIFSK